MDEIEARKVVERARKGEAVQNNKAITDAWAEASKAILEEIERADVRDIDTLQLLKCELEGLKRISRRWKKWVSDGIRAQAFLDDLHRATHGKNSS